MNENRNLRLFRRPEFTRPPTLVVGWSSEAGKLGAKTVRFLREKTSAAEFAEIEPTDFFPLNGVSVEEDVARFPESKFYCSEAHNLAIFESDPPRSGWHSFLNTVLDVAEKICRVKEFHTIGGMIFFGAHTAPRELLSVCNSSELRESLKDYDLSRQMEYETPPGQRPTLSSYLLWLAKKRSLDGVSLWTPIPFYLIESEDPLACKRVAEFIDKRVGLGLDFTDVDREVSAQTEKLSRLRANSVEVDGSIRKLESHIGLTQEENEKLAREVGEFLKKSD